MTRTNTRILPVASVRRKGILQRTVLKRKKEGTKSEGATEDKDKDKDSKKTGPTSPFKIPPKDNEPKSKKIGDVEASWCE